MGKESILYGIIGLLAGIIIATATATYAVNNNHQGMMGMMGMRTDASSETMMGGSDMTMNGMVGSLEGKTGDDFDRAFLSQMIVHHNGAIAMANLAKQNAKHDELKRLADDIIRAQTEEIEQMRTWQREWGYGTSEARSGTR